MKQFTGEWLLTECYQNLHFYRINHTFYEALPTMIFIFDSLATFQTPFYLYSRSFSTILTGHTLNKQVIYILV